MLSIRRAGEEDLEGCYALDRQVIGDSHRAPFLTSRFEQGRLFVAETEERIVGFIAYENDWMGQMYVSLVCVHPQYRRRGIAMRLFQAVEVVCETGSLFSSAEEDNLVSMQMHERLGFRKSGYIENLPQPSREAIFFKEAEQAGRR